MDRDKKQKKIFTLVCQYFTHNPLFWIVINNCDPIYYKGTFYFYKSKIVILIPQFYYKCQIRPSTLKLTNTVPQHPFEGHIAPYADIILHNNIR